MAIIPLANAGSIPSNHGSPTPIGNPSINNSTDEPIESRSRLIFSNNSDILTTASGSLQFKRDISVPLSKGDDLSNWNKGLERISPTLARWALQLQPTESSKLRA
jgi:hypothetical protein